jgi:hypothetical protein
MDDRLEKYIKSHRADFDDKEPRKDLWEDIEQQLGEGKKQVKMSRSFIYWRAAAVLMFFVISLLVFDKINQNMPNDEQVDITEISPDLLEAESFYTSLIDQKSKEIDVKSMKYGLEEEFHAEIEVLDSLYLTLKNDLKFGNEEVLVDAMILNLQLRIEILNQQLSIIQSIENRQKDEATIL